MEIDYETLARRILRPDRPWLAEARAAVAGIADPDAITDDMIALVAPELVDDV